MHGLKVHVFVMVNGCVCVFVCILVASIWHYPKYNDTKKKRSLND